MSQPSLTDISCIDEDLIYFEISCVFQCDWSNAMLEMSREFFFPLSDNNSLSSTSSSRSSLPLSFVLARRDACARGVVHCNSARFGCLRLATAAATSATVTSSASLTSPSRSLGPRRFFDQCCDVARVDELGCGKSYSKL